MILNSLRKLFDQELRSLLSAEDQQGSGLMSMYLAASDPNLRAALQKHMEQTRGHIRRLEQIITSTGTSLLGSGSRAIIALLEEANYLIGQSEASTRDAVIVRAVRAVEHLEIAYYTSAYDHAQELGKPLVAKMLHEILVQERQADIALASIGHRHVDTESKRQEYRVAA